MGEVQRILFLGDIVGEPGREAVYKRLPSLREEEQIDFVIANGENIACLLYTSPSPRDLSTSRMPSSA